MLKLITSLIICLGVGAIGGLFTSSSIPTWYTGLIKPSFNPPNWLFGPVWTILYIMMAVSLYLAWKSNLKDIKIALIVFGIQLILNLFWSIIFFYLHQPLIAFIEIIVLWLTILTTIVKFYPINKISAYLLIPYLLWVSFASFLNLSIYWLNR